MAVSERDSCGWRGKELVIDNYRNADREMLEHNITVEDIISVLESGVEVRKQKKGSLKGGIIGEDIS